MEGILRGLHLRVQRDGVEPGALHPLACPDHVAELRVDRLSEGVALLAREVRHMPPPDLPDVLSAIRNLPDDDKPWQALEGWLTDNGEYDVAAAVRMFWCVLLDSMEEGKDVADGLAFFRKHARLLARYARKIERENEERRVLDADY
jgi:hypothetical protein